MNTFRSKSSTQQTETTQDTAGSTLNLKKADSYILPKCIEHPQQVLQRICITKNCPSYFHPTCMDCMESGHDHKIKGLQNIKPILVGFTDQVLQFERNACDKYHENDELHYNLYKMVIKFSKQFKNLADSCTQISQELNQQAEDLVKVVTGEQSKIKSKEYLTEIFNSSASAHKLKKNLKLLERYVVQDKNNPETLKLDISPDNKDKEIDMESTIADIRFFLSSNFRKIQDTLKVVQDTNLEDLVVEKNSQEQKIPLQGCIKCQQRYEETQMAQSEVCGHFYCKKCLSSFKDIFIKSKNNPYIKCLGHLNKVCNKQLSRKQWEQIMGMSDRVIVKHSQSLQI